jgi:HPt (histidine-containing phosphotransfer) domain-containing protein
MNFKELADNLGLDVDEYMELIELFIDTGSADFLKIQEALASKDADQVMRSAHTIKGAAGNLGLLDVSEVAGTIEKSASKNELDALTPVVHALKTQFEAIDTFVHG